MSNVGITADIVNNSSMRVLQQYKSTIVAPKPALRYFTMLLQNR